MIKYKNLCGYNLSMATKDGLTRDEAREAIKILTLRNDNLDIITMGTLGILITLLSVLITIVIGNPKLSGVSLDYSVELFILSVLIFIFLIILSSRSSNIYEAANKLAKDHNLEKFFRATLGKKVVFEWINKMMKK